MSGDELRALVEERKTASPLRRRELTDRLAIARPRLLAAERESIEALRDYWIARAALEMALGGRSPAASGTSATPKAEPDDAMPQDHEHLHGKN